MRWLKHIVSLGMVIAAFGIALSTGLSDHTHDYGQVPLPEGGVVDLPAGTVIVYYTQAGDGSDPIRVLTQPLTFQAVPVGGGPAVPMRAQGGSTPDVAVQRSQTIGELGAVAKLDVPSSGLYQVSGSTNLPAGTSSLKLGTNAGTALVHKWKLLAGLLIGAFLISLIPVPRHRREETGAPLGWSSNPRSPYVG
jgi:hypothetical protein